MSSITAGTTSTTTLIHSGDTTGSLVFKTNDTGSGGTTAVTLDTSQNATFAGKVTSAGALTLASNGTTTAVTIDTSQRVGIGTASPTQALTVAGQMLSIASSGASFKNITPTTGNNYMWLGNTGNNLYVGKESSAGGTLFVGSSAYAAVIGNDGAYPLQFATNNNVQATIDSSGNLLVGTTSAIAKVGVVFDGSTNNGCVLRTSTNASGTGFLYFQENGNTCGSVTRVGTTSAVTYSSTSDYRLKENITPMTGALSKVARLKPVTYTWKSGGESAEGFIAHELAEVCPDAVVGTKDELDKDGNPKYQSIDTSFLVATLTAALQETKALIDQQAETINALTARVVALEGQ